KLQNIAHEIIIESKARGLVDCETIVELGDLQDRIVEISSEGYDMIVMGTTGVGKNLIIGSNTSRVIQKSAIPVFCVPQQAGYEGFKRIVYATDVQEADKMMIQRVVSFATFFQSRVNVLHVSQEGHEEEKGVVEEFFSDLKTFVPYNKISFESRTIHMELSQALLEYMEEIKGDLLVVYSKHRNFLEKIMHKSLTKKLSLIVNKPLFVIK
ncbi:MAG: universal stress protein, partial [Cyclobacteriaceae bacterium]|nr:universal stress protein [Cyclobacteriaceae bacterium]